MGVDPEPDAVGERIRMRRRELGLTLQDLAHRTGFSRSFLSQVEIGRSRPSVSALARIRSALDMTTSMFTADEPDRRVRVVRKDRRKAVAYPGGRHPLELLTPDLQRRFEVTLSHDAPGPWHDAEPPEPAGEVFGFVLEGAYEIEMDAEVHTVRTGDSIHATPRGPYRVRVASDGPARAIWIAIPPAF
ncbi:XRE family transcriptional regulator [Actinobacteria bacterium YIM 96077]|uniref:HTH cro/C1-type domain-containing protein n=1 Tax=Phytoactinopolyspora halophila TaxID=1981511 RepID=A0A329QNX7_9ACTN|nr:XRE family transcriptional regulator [Phytoactinopolyspora halophila]AYY14550.1 XRE family transcriptional regulator [Actinobacteria bacterium YIM 96077]RAW14074.1 hypothetical protein DPM12_11665 [Phytoactinopolyspora halophila]